MPRNSRNERPSGDRRKSGPRSSSSPYKSSRPAPGGFRKKSAEGGDDKPRFSGGKSSFKRPGGRFESREGDRKEGPFKKSFDRKGPSERFEGGRGKEDRPFKKSFDRKEGGDARKSFSRPGRTEDRGERSGGFKKPFDKSAGSDRPFKKSFDRKGDDRPGSREGRSFPKPSSRPYGESRFTKKGPYRKNEDEAPRTPREGDESREKRSYSGEFERKSFVKNRIDKARKGGKTKAEVKPASDSDVIRLNKYISNSGVCSRREADELIKMGLVTVNGVTVTEMGHKVKKTDEVRYEGKRLKAEKPVYILVNKPKGFITTTSDPQERNTVMHLIADACNERVYPVGRLDRNTTGLLLLTNDGDLADKLTHPSYNVKKIYKVELDRPITKADFQKIQEGIFLEEGKAVPDDVAIVSDDNKTIGIELHIGWNRIVRRIFESLQYEVVKLDRVVYAGLDKKNLGRGEWRFLKEEEVIRLKHLQ